MDLAASAEGHAMLAAGTADSHCELPPSLPPKASSFQTSQTSKRRPLTKKLKKPTLQKDPKRGTALALRVAGQRHTIRALEHTVCSLKASLLQAKALQAKASSTPPPPPPLSSRSSRPISIARAASAPGDDAAYKSLLAKHSSLRSSHSSLTSQLSHLTSSSAAYKSQLTRSLLIARDLRGNNRALEEEVEKARGRAEEAWKGGRRARVEGEGRRTDGGRGKGEEGEGRGKENATKGNASKRNAAGTGKGKETSETGGKEVKRLKEELRDAREDRDRVLAEVVGLRKACAVLRHRVK